MNLESAAVTGRGVDCCYIGRCLVEQRVNDTHPVEKEMPQNVETTELLHAKAGSQIVARERAEARIKDILYRTEGYRYTRSKSDILLSRFVCTQRSDTSRTTLTQENERKRRKRERALNWKAVEGFSASSSQRVG